MDTTLFPQDLFREKEIFNFEFSTILYGKVNQLEEFLTQSEFGTKTTKILPSRRSALAFKYKGFDSRFHKNWLSEIHISYIRKRNNPPDSGLISADP
ncbi:LOW QUALITY PROTEIN: hypothetical protein HID58_096111 [Brassica napus]|uniref:Uncharacterized protein n=1 Tax=Brassica napus TaxID=3708 RepID=A0ABQ7X1K0_BRANA|nr:LOW QUALITY PROTEIN: hypothetical protein HID58_096111 [Brassica napus]